MTTPEFAAWQLVTVQNTKGEPYHFVVYQDSKRDSAGHDNQYYVADIGEAWITGVSIHLHGAGNVENVPPDEICIGCQDCTEWDCTEYDKYEDNSLEPTPDARLNYCMHARALLQFMKNRELELKKPDFEEYTAHWISQFRIEKNELCPHCNRTGEMEEPAGPGYQTTNPADNSRNLPDQFETHEHG